MKRMFGLLLVLALVSVVAAQDAEEAVEKKQDPEAIEILKKVDSAVKAVDAVSYRSTVTPSGAATNFMPAPVEGEVVLVGWNGSMPNMFYGVVKTKNAENEAVEITAGGNGDSYFVIDHSTKKAYEDMDPAVMGRTGRAVFGLYMVEFVHDRPFDDELNGDVVELLGKETVAGEECYAVRVVYTGGQGETTWYFSTKDFLPRRRTQHISGQQGEGKIERVITELKISPKVEDALFTLNLPESYEQIDDFAP